MAAVPYWTIWLQHHPDQPSPSFLIAKAAIEKALPDFVLTFTTTSDEGGNPRDGYFHGVNLLATAHSIEIEGNFGVWSTSTPALITDQARYDLDSLALIVKSDLPWDAQEFFWHAITEAFAPIGYVDSTSTTPVFMEQIAHARQQLSTLS